MSVSDESRMLHVGRVIKDDSRTSSSDRAKYHITTESKSYLSVIDINCFIMYRGVCCAFVPPALLAQHDLPLMQMARRVDATRSRHGRQLRQLIS